MKALVKAHAKPGLWLTDVAEPDLRRDEVLIRVERTGICGTDLHILNWDPWARKTIPVPLVIGHEFVGRVVAKGSEVDRVQIGDVVSGEGHLACGRCRNCMAGRRHLCANLLGIGVNRAGAFAELVAIPADNAWRHSDDVDLDVAAISDPFGNAVHTALSFPVLGEDVLITGAGPIGIMAAAVVRYAGARTIVVTDVNPRRLAIAEAVGVTRAVRTDHVGLDQIAADLGVEEGFTVGLEMSGSPAALRDLLTQMAHGGRIALLGIPADEYAIDWSRVIFNMLTLKGVYGREIFETWYAMTAMLQAGLDITPVITHRFAYSEFSEAFATAASGEAGKVILDWTTAE